MWLHKPPLNQRLRKKKSPEQVDDAPVQHVELVERHGIEHPQHRCYRQQDAECGLQPKAMMATSDLAVGLKWTKSWADVDTNPRQKLDAGDDLWVVKVRHVRSGVGDGRRHGEDWRRNRSFGAGSLAWPGLAWPILA